MIVDTILALGGKVCRPIPARAIAARCPSFRLQCFSKGNAIARNDERLLSPRIASRSELVHSFRIEAETTLPELRRSYSLDRASRRPSSRGDSSCTCLQDIATVGTSRPSWIVGYIDARAQVRSVAVPSLQRDQGSCRPRLRDITWRFRTRRSSRSRGRLVI